MSRFEKRFFNLNERILKIEASNVRRYLILVLCAKAFFILKNILVLK